MQIHTWHGRYGSKATLEALNSAFAIIDFRPDGTILSANELFCSKMGYKLSEIMGRHHSIFVAPDEVKTPSYSTFWTQLARGEFITCECARIRKDGSTIWLQASYTPVKNSKGRVVRVIKLALDITAARTKAANDASLIEAIHRSQAVIEFTPDGQILDANDNFLKTMDYKRDEVIGQHHRMFAEPDYAASADYKQFWAQLKAGNFLINEFRRLRKGGREVWLQATYNPIFNAAGEVVKVIKFASDLDLRMENVTRLGRALRDLAKGDLEQRLGRALIPSLEPLRLNFNSAAEILQKAMQSVSTCAEVVHVGSNEISDSTAELSRRIQLTAANLERTAAALDEITATVKKTAESTTITCGIMVAAQSDAMTSEQVVHDAVAAMGGIQKSAQSISQIIGVIDEIAFQTNLLALNAGVEAARAGDAGRGFAVVASEVRALAQRSAESAKEIKSLIAGSTQQVSTGVALVGEAGQALARIAQRVSDMNEVIREITAGTQEQAVRLSEVNSSVNQMDQMTQQNAAMVEETSTASQHLAQEGEHLARLMSQFKATASLNGSAASVAGRPFRAA